MGHEFTSLVLALLQTGGYAPKADPAVLDTIGKLDADYHFGNLRFAQLPKLPDVVQALNLMAVLNPRVRHTMIDGAVFRDEVERAPRSWRCRRCF